MSDVDPMDMPLSGLRLVEASAGTGKTFSLAGLYLRLLVEKGLDVRDVLVVTFTRAATQELRERIRARIAGAARVAGDRGCATDTTEDRFALKLLGDSNEQPEMLARRLREAAARMDEATITTIHGFCQQALAENAFDSAVPFDRGKQADDRELLAEAAADFWRGRVIGRDPGGAARFLAHWPMPATLAKDLRWILDTPYLTLAGPSVAQVREIAAQALAGWQARAPTLRALLEEVEQAGELHGGRDLGKTVAACGGVASLFREIEATLDAGGAPHTALQLLTTDRLAKQFKGRAATAGVPADLTEPVDALTGLPALERLIGVREAAEAVQRALVQRKQERRSHSFNDMIQALHRAVTDPDRGPRLAEALCRRWPWALVDEFQDTDPLQYAILKAIYHRREQAGMVMIGDPKQAIYGFRGGDVFAYIEAAGDADDRYSLHTNFRSTGAVLQAIEALFTLPAERPFMLPEIGFVPVRAGRADRDRVIELDGQPLPALTLWSVESEASGKLLTAGVARGQLETATISQIRRLLDPIQGASVRENGARRLLAARDICVLVNTNSDAARFQATLARAGIPAACLHQSSVFASEQAGHLQRILEAAAAPSDPQRVRAALVTELFGLRLGDLLALADDDWQRVTEPFQQAQERWVGSGVLAMLEPLIQAAGGRLLRLEDGERRMTNWLHLADRLQQVEAETFGRAGLIRWLRHSREAAADGEADEEAQLRLESDENLVRIATVHKVKGLEFPVVLLPYAPLLGTSGAHFERPDRPPFRYHDADRNACLDLGSGQDAEHAPLAVRERRAEAMRLLYVALTRAMDAIFLPWGAINGAQNGALAWLFHQRDGAVDAAWQTGKQSADIWFTAANVRRRLEDLRSGAESVIALVPVAEVRASRDPVPQMEAPLEPARSDLPVPPRVWQVLSYSSLVRGEAGAPASAAGSDDESPDRGEATPVDPGLEGLSGTGFGSAVHDILEAAEFATWPSPGDPPGEREVATVSLHLQRRGILLPEGERGQRRAAAVSGLVSRCLHTPLPEIGSLSAVPAERRLAEMGFALRLGGQSVGTLTALLRDHGYPGLLVSEAGGRPLRGLLQGFIDLVVEHEGRYWVLDYKTNHLGAAREDYRPDRLAEAVRHGHYDLQYLIYVTALHRHLALRLRGYDPVRHLGGVQYLFIRGMNGQDDATGIFQDRPDPVLITALDRALDNREAAA